jgi:hypothetical protein
MRRGRGENAKSALLKIGTSGRISPESNPVIRTVRRKEWRKELPENDGKQPDPSEILEMMECRKSNPPKDLN